ncbi:MAG: branched-chain amino acid ABC transporter permease [Oscillospiraceae bacterium]|nr:branched-chain amino acid ABC transporter permease [Oscillospiraceae bacterium]
MSTIISQVINGLQTGSVYALVALGYSMVYGIIMLLNFAHGDVIMVGAYIAWFTMNKLGLHPAICIFCSIIGCTLLGVVIEKIAYKPLRSSPRISLLITAIGVSYLLENGAQLVVGAGAKMVQSPEGSYIISGPDLVMGGQHISFTAVITIVVSAISMIGLTFLVNKTKMGKAMRAVSEDTGSAQLMGIPVNRVISYTFAIGSALAGIGSVLYCCAYPQASPTMGAMLGLKAFVAAVLGGIGSIPGAMIGGYAIGLAEALVSAVGLSVWKDGVVFAILIIVLIVRPTGILGQKITEKV